MKQITRITLASFFLIMVSCEDNNTNEEVLAEFGSISGTVNFSGSWPDSGEVLITLDTFHSASRSSGSLFLYNKR